MRKPDRPKSSQIFRCAIYTRKSSDEGLEQEFNSLDAQREACEAFIVSQRHAGWIALPDMYETEASRAARWSARRCSGSSPL
jgi:site-specific DNA recombinase